MSDYVHKKHFSLGEARALLTSIHALALKMMELKQSLDARGWDIYRHEYFGGMGPNGTGAFPPEMETLIEIIKSFEQRGVIVKGVDEGLVDFPHIRTNGEEVYLCWKVGEDDIGYWHTMDGGYAGRRSVDEL